MSEERKQENNFKFGLYLRGEKIFERIFSADLYNPVVRYSVDIRSKIPTIIENMQEVLQTPSNKLNFDKLHGISINGFSPLWNVNTKKYYQHICSINKMHPIKLFVPFNYDKNKDRDAQQKQKFQNKGTEFKFGVYINQNPIVERNFYVDKYNPESRFSNELPETLNEIVKYLTSYLKSSDTNHMWNDYDLITTYGLKINEIRELSKDKREEFLRKKSDLTFVEKYRLENNRDSEYAL